MREYRGMVVVILTFLSFLLFTIYSVSAWAKFTSNGEALFLQKGCVGCHSLRGQGGRVGPALDTVGDRYNGEWLYTWLKNPSAVKPGTQMPTLDLTDDERAKLVFFLLAHRTGKMKSSAPARTKSGIRVNPPDLNPKAPENKYLALGVKTSYIRKQRYTLQDQIQTFIPPIFEPALGGSAFVLPPGATRLDVSSRFLSAITEDDFSGQREFGARVVDFDLKRRFLDFDALLGLDDNYTVGVKVPFRFSSVDAQFNPAFLNNTTVFPQGSSIAIGDVRILLKKKFVDQGNFPVGVAGLAVLRLPTGGNNERFDGRTTVLTPGGSALSPLPALDDAGNVIPGTADGTFRRFSNDGRLPAPLQPGLGTVGGAFGLFVTRQFTSHSWLGRGAIHVGGLYEIRPRSDGVDPGNRLTVAAAWVKPLIGDRLSLQLTYILKHQEEDSYDGKFAVPNGTGGFVVRDRPPFSGGTSQFLGSSLIFIPNPMFRIILSGVVNVDKPRLGPAPDYVIGTRLQYTFASGLFK